nr:SDR family NAD(P)-dependent oxidoreductase [Halorubrum sodomense]
MTGDPERIAGVEDVDCTGRQAFVTGSTSGIGRTAALALGRLGTDVIVHGRDREAGRAVVDELAAAALTGGSSGPTSPTSVPCANWPRPCATGPTVSTS